MASRTSSVKKKLALDRQSTSARHAYRDLTPRFWRHVGKALLVAEKLIDVFGRVEIEVYKSYMVAPTRIKKWNHLFWYYTIIAFRALTLVRYKYLP